MATGRLSCRELDDFLAAYFDDTLAADLRSAVELHLAVCPACLDYLAGYREAVRLGRAACGPGLDAEADAPRELVDAILALRRT